MDTPTLYSHAQTHTRQHNIVCTHKHTHSEGTHRSMAIPVMNYVYTRGENENIIDYPPQYFPQSTDLAL